MPYAKKIVLHCPNGYTVRLDSLVEEFIRDGVKLVAVVGKNCKKIEDIIDELVVGDGSNDGRFLVSTAHPDGSIEEAIEFAKIFESEYEEIQVVEL